MKKHLAVDAAATPPAGSPRAGTQPRVVTPELEEVIRGMLRADVELKASVIHERLVHERGVPVHYQRVKLACRELRGAGGGPGRIRTCDTRFRNPSIASTRVVCYQRFSTVDLGAEGVSCPIRAQSN